MAERCFSDACKLSPDQHACHWRSQKEAASMQDASTHAGRSSSCHRLQSKHELAFPGRLLVSDCKVEGRRAVKKHWCHAVH